MLDNVVSTVKGIASVITGGISKVLGMFFVTDGYVTSTTKTEDTKVKSDLKPEKKKDTTDLIAEYWSTQWDKVEKSASNALTTVKKVFYAAGRTLKDIFWTLHVEAWKNIVKTYEKYWDSASKRYDPSKQKNLSEEVKKKQNKMTVDLAKIATVIPGFEAIQSIADALNGFAETVSTSYHDLSDPKIDPTAPIQSLLDLIKPLTEAFLPLEDFAGGSIPAGLLELPAVLDSLLQVNNAASSGKKKIRKFNPEIPTSFKDACEAFTKAIESMSIKSLTFIVLVICKIIEVIVEIIRVISDLAAGPAMPLIDELFKPVSAVLKAVPIAYSLVSEAPLAIKVIGEGTVRKLMAAGAGEMFGEFPDEIDINLFGTDVITVLNVEPTEADLKEAEAKYGVNSTEANEIRDIINENNLIDKYGSTDERRMLAYENAFSESLKKEEEKLNADLKAASDDLYDSINEDLDAKIGSITPLNDLPQNILNNETQLYSKQTNLSFSLMTSNAAKFNEEYSKTNSMEYKESILDVGINRTNTNLQDIQSDLPVNVEVELPDGF